MHLHHNDSNQSGKPTPFVKSGYGVALIMLALIVGFYLLKEHWAHLGQSWPYLLLLLCPLMHVFMHGGHGHGHGNSDHNAHSKKPFGKDNNTNA